MKKYVYLVLCSIVAVFMAGCSGTTVKKNVDFRLDSELIESLTINSYEYDLYLSPDVDYNSDEDAYYVKNCTVISRKNPNSKVDDPIGGEIVTILNAANDTLLTYSTITDCIYTSYTTYAKFYKQCSQLSTNPRMIDFEGEAIIAMVNLEVTNGTYRQYKLLPDGESYLLYETQIVAIPDYDSESQRGMQWARSYFSEFYPNGQIKKYIDNNGIETRYNEKGERIQVRSTRRY